MPRTSKKQTSAEKLLIDFEAARSRRDFKKRLTSDTSHSSVSLALHRVGSRLLRFIAIELPITEGLIDGFPVTGTIRNISSIDEALTLAAQIVHAADPEGKRFQEILDEVFYLSKFESGKKPCGEQGETP